MPADRALRPSDRPTVRRLRPPRRPPRPGPPRLGGTGRGLPPGPGPPCRAGGPRGGARIPGLGSGADRAHAPAPRGAGPAHRPAPAGGIHRGHPAPRAGAVSDRTRQRQRPRASDARHGRGSPREGAVRRLDGRMVGRSGSLPAAGQPARGVCPAIRPSDRPTVRPSARGFSLLELLADIAISGLVFLLASRLLSVAIGSSSALREARSTLDREQNGYRWLRSAFGSLDLSAAPGGFEGQPDRVTFGAWRPAAAGWSVPRRVRLEVVDGVLSGQEDREPPLRLADSVAALSVDYLLEPGADTRW